MARRKRRQPARVVKLNICPKCGSLLRKMSDPEGKDWNFCLECYNIEKLAE